MNSNMLSSAYRALVFSLITIFDVVIPYLFHFGHRTYQIHIGDDEKPVIKLPGWSHLTKKKFTHQKHVSLI